MIHLFLPFPPSINHYYGTQKGRFGKYIKDKGVMYRNNVFIEAKKCGGMMHWREPLKIVINMQFHDKRKRDLDNILKCLFDSLEKACVVDNDAWFHHLDIKKQFGCIINQLEVFIYTYKELNLE